MITDFDKKYIVIGISACLMGEKVRFDTSSKLSQFCVNDLGQHVSYRAFCPEVAVGLPTPRPTIRQIKKGDVIHVSRPDGSGDVTEALSAYGKKVAELAKNFSAYIFCAKSPSCGMERVKIYNENGDALPAHGVGMFAQEIMKANPLLPCEENGRLNDPILRENFVARVYAYRHWQELCELGITKHRLTTFHSQYKYTLMSHNLVAYKSLGQLLARADLPVEQMADEFIAGLMQALKIPASRKNHVNTLYHIQGYFSDYLNPLERKELSEHIELYRKGLVALMVPMMLIKHYQLIHHQPYLAKQAYLSPYPDTLKLRYGY